MLSITLKPLYHRKQESIGIYYANSPIVNGIVKSIQGVKWSQTNKCWYLPLSKENYNKIHTALRDKSEIITEELKSYLEKRKSVIAAAIPTATNKAANKKRIPPASPVWQLSKENLQAAEKFIQELKLKAYSPSTIITYRNEFLQLLQTIKNKPARELTADELRRYFVYCYEKLKLTENTLHSRINAIKFYYEQVLKKEKFFWEIPRPKKAQQLPKVFSQDDVAAIINNAQNKKHKAMLMLAYSAGLRISEVVTLKTHEIDSKRMTIFISAAKGKKDRQVSLSPVLLVMLREYAMEYKPGKKGYLFEGNEKGSHYSTRSLQEVIQSAKKKAGIMKSGSIHALRHSFATHLIEKGTDITMIQKLLGHNDIKTTLIYLHTSNKDLLKIISPLDDLALT